METPSTTHPDIDALRDLNGQYIHSVVHSDVGRFTEILSEDFLPEG